MLSENLMQDLNKIYKNDELIKQLMMACGLSLDEFTITRDDLVAQYDMDSMTWGIALWEKLLNIKTDANKPIQDRRSQIEARWKSDGKSDITLIQEICNGWLNGEVLVTFIGGKVKLDFKSILGIPSDLQGLLNSVNELIPAHLEVIYEIKYLTWDSCEKANKTWTQFETLNMTWDLFEVWKP